MPTETELTNRVKDTLSQITQEQEGRGNSDASIIARRGAVSGSSFKIVSKAERLMPLAESELLHADKQGKSISSGTVWWASSLAGSKGRMDRQWWAPEGGIYFAIALYPELETCHFSLYSLAMGMAVAQAVIATGADARIRWINDVLINDKKISGTLTQTTFLPDSGENWLLIGTGINANMATIPAYLPHATSILKETGEAIDLQQLGTAVIAWFGWYVGMLHQWDANRLDMHDENVQATGRGRVNPLIENWKMLSDTPGRPIRFGQDLEREQGEEGFCLDITGNGALLIQTLNGETIEFDSGEVRYV